ncbi:hypothetical protein [Falsibacillus pallidus]|uniref:hypothetical protein n=1 Tax=Falsibacillus pallidus TaxID=493781 RepID=UPI000E0A4F60|nr:hypothetical protein [Falsibacillus pallidus]
MNKRFSTLSSILILIGILVTLAKFYYGSSSWEGFFGVISIGIAIFIFGVIFGVMAFAKKEKGVLKYISVFSVIIAVFFVGYLA